MSESMETITLDEALEAMTVRNPQLRPFGHRVEGACNAATRDVISTYGLELGSESAAIRDLLARGAASVAAERAARA